MALDNPFSWNRAMYYKSLSGYESRNKVQNYFGSDTWNLFWQGWIIKTTLPDLTTRYTGSITTCASIVLTRHYCCGLAFIKTGRAYVSNLTGTSLSAMPSYIGTQRKTWMEQLLTGITYDQATSSKAASRVLAATGSSRTSLLLSCKVHATETIYKTISKRKLKCIILGVDTDTNNSACGTI
jgi:hypothetical protein